MAAMTKKQLRAARKKLGLTITEMALALNTPRGTYEKWEAEGWGRRVPGVIKIAVECLLAKKGGE